MTINNKKILFAILAGGQSKRFGGGFKAFAKINGITILDKIINKLKKYKYSFFSFNYLHKIMTQIKAKKRNNYHLDIMKKQSYKFPLLK